MTETRWLDREEHNAWIRLVAVTLLLPSSLDNQLQRDAGLTHFGYLVLAMLSESQERTLPMTRPFPGCRTSLPGSSATAGSYASLRPTIVG